MVRFSYFIVLFSLVCSCAQIGSITGGSKDITPPQIVVCTPFDGQKNVSTDQMIIEFDEYIKLDKPKENIVLLPANVKFEYVLKGKTLIIDFKNELYQNTTYSLYLNEAVKDITEGNDSLIQLVFSTGADIDSNRVSFEVVDAFTNTPKKNVLIGLYDSLHQEKPTYFSRTDKSGYVEMKAVSDGDFYYKVFLDGNKNRISDANELQYADRLPIRVDTAYSDTIRSKISKPLKNNRELAASYLTPYILAVSTPEGFGFDSLFCSTLVLTEFKKQRVGDDSMHYYLPAYFESMELTLDTLRKKVRNTETLNEISLLDPISQYVVLPSMRFIELKFNTPINSISFRDDAFRLFNPSDSSYAQIDSSMLSFDDNLLKFRVSSYEGKYVKFLIDSGSVYGPDGLTNSSIEIMINKKTIEELGILNVQVESQLGSYFVELRKNKNVMERQTSLSKSEHISFKNLLPGTYTIALVDDTNQNDKWDPFNPIDFAVPENRYMYKKPVIIKANWEHEVVFKILN